MQVVRAHRRPPCLSPAGKCGLRTHWIACGEARLQVPAAAHQEAGAALSACLEDTRQLYNAALEERREAWRMGRHKVTFYSQDAQLKEIRADDPERHGRWAFNCERAAIRRLDRAFQGFFRRVKAGEKPGYPGSRGAAGGTPSNGRRKGGARWDSVPHPKVTRVYLKDIGHVRVHQHRAVRGRVKTITAKREGGAGTWCCRVTTFPPSRWNRPARRRASTWAWPRS